MPRHSQLTGAELHEPKGIDTAVAGTVYQANGSGSGSWSVLTPTDIVLVSSQTDFPSVEDGAIPLADSTRYVLLADITVSLPFRCGAGSFISTSARSSYTLTYTGVVPMFEGGDDLSIRLERLKITCASAPLTNMPCTLANLGSGISFVDCNVLAQSGGTLTNTSYLVHYGTDFTFTNNGFTFAGTDINPLYDADRTVANISAGHLLNLGDAVFNAFRVQYSHILGAGGFINSVGTANIVQGTIAILRDCAVLTTTKLSGGLTNRTVRWAFHNCNGVQSTNIGAASHLPSGTVVNVATAGVDYPISGTWVEDYTSYFTASAGVLTYNGERELQFNVIGSATVQKVGGGADEVNVGVAVNGVRVPRSNSVTSSATQQSVTSHTFVALQPGDTVSLVVANATSTADITCSLANLTVNRLY